jgi:hypothetical protein
MKKIIYIMILVAVTAAIYGLSQKKDFEARLDKITGRNQTDVFQIIDDRDDDMREVLIVVWNKVFRPKDDASRLWNDKLLALLTVTGPGQLAIWGIWDMDEIEGQAIIDQFLIEKTYSQNEIENQSALLILSQRNTKTAQEFVNEKRMKN